MLSVVFCVNLLKIDKDFVVARGSFSSGKNRSTVDTDLEISIQILILFLCANDSDDEC